MKRWLSLFVLCLSGLLAKEQTHILFYLQDAGETYGLLPVIQQLEEKGVDYRILAAGVAQDLLPKTNLPQEKIRSFQDVGIDAQVDRSWERNALLTDEQIQKLVDEIEVQEVVTGVAFATQGQVLEAYRQQGKSSIAFWDNFNADGDNPYFKTAREVETHASVLLLPSALLSSSFETPLTKKIVGQPTLKDWEEKLAKMDPQALRQKLGLDASRKVAVFIGGYGADFEESFQLFLDAVAAYDNPDACFLIQAHPKTGGVYEKAQVAKRNDPRIRVLQGELTTQEAASISQAVLCHISTVSFQALAAQKAVIHFIPSQQSFDSLALQKGIALKVTTPAEFSAKIEEAFSERTIDFYTELEIPENSVELCVEALLEDF